MITLFFTLH